MEEEKERSARHDMFWIDLYKRPEVARQVLNRMDVQDEFLNRAYEDLSTRVRHFFASKDRLAKGRVLAGLESILEQREMNLDEFIVGRPSRIRPGFGLVLVKLMNEQGVTQEELAQGAGTTLRTIARYCSKDYCRPHFSIMKNICRYLDTPLGTFYRSV